MRCACGHEYVVHIYGEGCGICGCDYFAEVAFVVREAPSPEVVVRANGKVEVREREMVTV